VDITKEDLIKLLQEEQKKYEKDNPNEIITRNFFRRITDNKYENEIELLFRTFSNYKKEAGLKKKKSTKGSDVPFIQRNEDKNRNKRYFISAIIAGADINIDFLESVESYCKINNTEFLLIPMRGVKRKDEFSTEILDKYSKYFVSDIKFNNNLRALDFCLSPEQVLPLTGLSRFGKKESSIILASPKQMLLSIPKKKESLPHIILSTGTICEPEYNYTKMGRMASQDNVVGGLIVEIRNKDIFHIRHIRSDKDGGFQDLDCYYKGNTIKKIPAECISIEPHYGVEDDTALQSIKDLVKLTQCKRVLFHDIMDCRSVNPHEQKSTSMKYYRPENQRTLENELNHLKNKLIEWNTEFPKLELKVVASNHEQFIRRYLESGDFITDTHNAYLGCELLQAILRRQNPIEYYIHSRKDKKVKNLTFFKEDESFSINGIELNTHGHFGSNGSRGSNISLETINGKSTSGHCFSDDTEILTKRGWILGLQLKEDDEVATMNKQTQVMEWNKINKYFEYENYKELYHIQNKHFDLLVTDEHGLLFKDHYNNLRETSAKKLFDTSKKRGKFIIAVDRVDGIEYNEKELQMIVQIVTDGTFAKNSIRWHLKKERKINRLCEILSAFNYVFSVKKYSDGTTCINLSAKDSKYWIELLNNRKVLPQWIRKLNKECAEIVFKEYAITDGHQASQNSIQIASSKEEEIDILQELAVLNGFRSSKIYRERNRLCLSVSTFSTSTFSKSRSQITKENYNGKVWCVSVDNGTVIVRRNGKTCVTLNSHTPTIFRDVYVSGCACKLQQDYNSKSASSWLHGAVVQYQNGNRQLIIIIDGKWKI
jgi:hypothetical protein